MSPVTRSAAMKVLLSPTDPGARASIGDPLAAKAAPIAPQEIGGDPAFIQKDEASRVERRGSRRPLRAGGRDVGAIVFGRAYRFFFKR